MSVKYTALIVAAYSVTDEERRGRGWKKDGMKAGVTIVPPEGEREFRELVSEEGVAAYYRQPSWEFRCAFIRLLNEFGLEGWSVVSFTAEEQWGNSGYRREPWPMGD